MSERVSLSEDLTDDQWMGAFEELGNDRGFFHPIGDDYGAFFTDASQDVLVVSFDTLDTARDGSPDGLPHALWQSEMRGWSHLSIITETHNWFRDPAVYAYFDRLVDDGFFEDFDRVVFYGAGMCGYAAAAYSVTAPGATVIAVAPQATLDPVMASWDDRYTTRRRLSFSDRYGYAPDMIDAADEVYLIYDPFSELDAMHAALFRAPNVHAIRFRMGGTRIGWDLEQMNALGVILDQAAAGTLTPQVMHQVLRKRRSHMPYLRNLLNHVHIEDRQWLTAVLCRSVLARIDAPRFRHHLELAEHKLKIAGRELPKTIAERRSAETVDP
jgi:hypothetical protein